MKEPKTATQVASVEFITTEVSERWLGVAANQHHESKTTFNAWITKRTQAQIFSPAEYTHL